MSDKIERELQGAEAAAYLRALADGLEADAVPVVGQICRPAGPLVAKEKHKAGGKGSLAIKLDLRGEAAEPETRPEVEARPKYKTLKKRMKDDYKGLLQPVVAGALPPDELVRRFVRDCHTMTTYPGKGDPLYPAFRAAADALQRAADACDVEACGAALGKLRHLWKEGHKEYK